MVTGTEGGERFVDGLRVAWEDIEARFRSIERMSTLITDFERDPSVEQIRAALDMIDSQLAWFAEDWLHFHFRLEAVLSTIGRAGASPPRTREAPAGEEDLELVPGSCLQWTR
jgi:hypothetical protein